MILTDKVTKHHHNMKVIKRDGSKQDVSLDKVTFRIKNLCDGLDIDPIVISTKVCSQIYDGVKTSQLDELAAEICIAKMTEHPNYGELATRIIISNNHKNTSPSFSETIEHLYNNVDSVGKKNSLISKRLYNVVLKHKSKLNSVIDYERDYSFDYFAFKTLEKSYLIKVGGVIVERIQQAIMRVSLGIYFEDLAGVLKCYEYFSQKYFTHASPTWYHSGMKNPNFLSCFLLGTDDSIEGIYKTIGDCAKISKGAGGIGVHISNIRSRNSYIRGTNGKSSGIIPMLKVYNETAKHVNQSGKRPGAFAMYLEPHHPDILDFLELKKNHGDEDERARDLFLALWVSDLFMERVKNGELWSLMDPDECPGLQDAYGDKYRALYLKYEAAGKFLKQVPAEQIWQNALKSQIETGVPYIGYKDAVNMKSNHQNLGTIKSSNLCVSGHTMILTDKGYVQISTVAGQKVNVWNGEEFSESKVMQTGVLSFDDDEKHEDMLKICFSNGSMLKCTKYHRFILRDGTEVRAEELRPGTELIDFEFKKCIEIKHLIDKYNNNPGIDTRVMHANMLGIYAEIRRDGNVYLHTDDYNVMKTENSFLTDNGVFLDGGKLDRNVKVESINEIPFEDTYCFNEPKKHMGVFNGVMAMNCIEINEYSDADEYACCCLASICLPRFVVDGKFDHDKLIEVCKVVVKNLNNIVDLNSYPVPETKLSNEQHRPLGVGVQGLADVYQIMKIPFDSEAAKKLNIEIFETLYYGCMLASYEQAVQRSDRIAEMRAAKGYSYEISDMHVSFEDYLWEMFPEGLTVIDYKRIMKMYKRKMYDVSEDGSIILSEYYTDLEKLHLTIEKVEALVEATEEDCLYYKEGDRYVTCNEEYEDLEPLMVSEFERDDAVCGSYVTFEGSPLSKGQFQFDMWGSSGSARYDWDGLRSEIMKRGVRNSLLVALMPTASTSQIMGNNECIEPYTSNIYVRNTLAGAFTVVNKHLINDLVDLGLWTKDLKNMIIAQNGSVQGLDIVPKEIQEIYKTAWELKQKVLIDQAADRGRFICQTQSMNLFFVEPPVKVLHSAQMYGWKRGLKTGSYYIRSLPKSQAQQFTIDPKLVERMKSSASGGMSVVSGVSSLSGVSGGEIAYVSSPSGSSAGAGEEVRKVERVMTEAEKEKREREAEVQKIMGRACSIFNSDCEACSS